MADQVTQFNLGVAPTNSTELTALELFNQSLVNTVAPQEAQTSQQVVTNTPNENVNLTAEELIAQANKPKEETDSSTADLNSKAAGRPTEKLSDQTKEDILALIELGELEGFEDGKYETKKDLQDLLKANKDRWKDEAFTSEKENFVNKLSPGMKVLAQYAEQVQNPQELIPFLTAIDNHQYVAELDVTNENDQEEIIRQSLSLRGFPEDQIQADIDDIKERGKLEEKAKALQPQLQLYMQQQVVAIQKQKEQEILQQQQRDQLYQQEVKKAIDVPELEGLKLKKEHKELIYAGLTGKDQNGELYVYSLINNLLAKKDYNTLAEIVLLGADKKAYKSYTKTVQQAADAQDTIRKLNTKGGTVSSIAPQDINTNSTKNTVARPTRNGFSW